MWLIHCRKLSLDCNMMDGVWCLESIQSNTESYMKICYFTLNVFECFVKNVIILQLAAVISPV